MIENPFRKRSKKISPDVRDKMNELNKTLGDYHNPIHQTQVVKKPKPTKQEKELAKVQKKEDKKLKALEGYARTIIGVAQGIGGQLDMENKIDNLDAQQQVMTAYLNGMSTKEKDPQKKEIIQKALEITVDKLSMITPKELATQIAPKLNALAKGRIELQEKIKTEDMGRRRAIYGEAANKAQELKLKDLSQITAQELLTEPLEDLQNKLHQKKNLEKLNGQMQERKSSEAADGYFSLADLSRNLKNQAGNQKPTTDDLKTVLKAQFAKEQQPRKGSVPNFSPPPPPLMPSSQNQHSGYDSRGNSIYENDETQSISSTSDYDGSPKSSFNDTFRAVQAQKSVSADSGLGSREGSEKSLNEISKIKTPVKIGEDTSVKSARGKESEHSKKLQNRRSKTDLSEPGISV